MKDGVPHARILIADTQAMFREGLRKLLEREPDFRVVGDTDDGEKIVDLVLDLKPDVLLLDLKLHHCPGLRTLRELASTATKVRPILLTSAIEKHEVIEALQFGARGVVPKDSETCMLFKSIRTVMAGGYWVGRDSISELVKSLRFFREQASRHQKYDLSRQELKIVEAIVAGCTNKEIARELSVTDQTVKHCLTTIFAKVGVSGRMELALFAINNGLVPDS